MNIKEINKTAEISLSEEEINTLNAAMKILDKFYIISLSSNDNINISFSDIEYTMGTIEFLKNNYIK